MDRILKRVAAVTENHPLLRIASSFTLYPRTDDVRARLTAMGDISTDWHMIGNDLKTAIQRTRREIGVD